MKRFPTIINLMNSLLGAGILGIPKAMDYCGINPSVCY
jgi:amino acid permease